MNRRSGLLVAALLLAGAGLLGGCLAPDSGAQPSGTVSPWLTIELTDVATGQAFRIADFKGKPVLLESFAVWCPTCTAQQREIAKLKDRTAEAIVHISLDTDPNEDEDRVRQHIQRNGFDWHYVVSPIEFTQALIDEFGLVVVNAPRAPMILICEDQSTRLLRTGVKSADDLLAEVEAGCQ